MQISDPAVQQIQFVVAGWQANYDFRTATSLSLRVGRDSLILGWIDIHYPCDEHIKLQIRGALPDECLTREITKEFIDAILVQLDIPSDETYEADFFQQTKGVGHIQFVDRNGIRDRLCSYGVSANAQRQVKAI